MSCDKCGRLLGLLAWLAQEVEHACHPDPDDFVLVA